MPIVRITSPISQPLVLDRGYSVSVTPLSGSCRVQIPGEGVSDTLTAAASYGPYSARRDVVMTIDSGVVEYDVDEAGGAGGGGPTTLPALQTVFGSGTPAQKAAFQVAVAGGVQLTTADAIADAGPRPHLTPGRITDGDEAGAPVVWWSPSGSGGFWGYDISPTDKFGV